MVNRVKADNWFGKVAQTPKQLPQSKKIVNILPVSGIPRSFLVQTERNPPIWKWISLDEAASKGSAVVVAPVDILPVLLPGESRLHTRMGNVSAVAIHPVDQTSKEAGTILATLTIGTLHGYVASFYYRSWGGPISKDNQWILTALYRHVPNNQQEEEDEVPAAEEGHAITGLWLTDELILSVSENHQYSFWSRTNTGDTFYHASMIAKTKLGYKGVREGAIQLMMTKAKGEFCRHSAPVEFSQFRFNAQNQTVIRTCERICSLIRSNRLKLKDDADPPVVYVAPTTLGCASQVVFSLGGGISVWAYHAATSNRDTPLNSTVQISPKQILASLEGPQASSQSFSILQIRLLDDSKYLIRPGLEYRDKMMVLIRFGSGAVSRLVLTLWKLDYTSPGIVPELLLATPIGESTVSQQFEGGDYAKLFCFPKPGLVLVALPDLLVLVALPGGHIKTMWPHEDHELAPLPRGTKISPTVLITACSAREDLGILITAHGDLKIRAWSAETGGLQMRLLDMNASATASSGGGSWVSSTKLPLRAIHALDPFTFVALDPNCIYIRQIKKYA